jgi:alkylhydroperoxidase family enzyme
VIADPAAVTTGAPRTQMIAELAMLVTKSPWYLTRAHLARARTAGLSDADVLHVVALASYFGHLNRIADAVAVPLDYEVALVPPRTDPSAPPLDPAPTGLVGRPALELGTRTDTANALAEWRTYIFQRDAPLTRRQRTLIARHVAAWLGDGGISLPTDLTANPLDEALRELAETLTLAPWKLDDSSFEALRDNGFDDTALFDVCATTSSAGVFSRIEVALIALGS